MKKLTFVSVVMMLAMACFVSCKPRTASLNSDINGSLNIELPVEMLAALAGTSATPASDATPIVIDAEDLMNALKNEVAQPEIEVVEVEPCVTPLEKFTELYKYSTKIAKLLYKANNEDAGLTISLATQIAKLAVEGEYDIYTVQEIIEQANDAAANKKAELEAEKENAKAEKEAAKAAKKAEKEYNNRPFAVFVRKYLKKEVLDLAEIQAALQAKLPANEVMTYELKVGYYEENSADVRRELCKLAAANLIDLKVEHMKRQHERTGYFVEVSLTEKGKTYMIEEYDYPCEELIEEIAEEEYQEREAAKARTKKKESTVPPTLYQEAKAEEISHIVVLASYTVVSENAHNIQVVEEGKDIIAEAEYTERIVEVTPFGKIIDEVKEGVVSESLTLQVKHRHAFDRGWYWE